MINIEKIIEIYSSLINNLGISIIIALVLSKTNFFKSLIINTKISVKDKIILSCIFGAVGIIATYTGIPIKGALANFRAIGAVIGGILGGFWVGLGAGLIAGTHRWLIDIGGFTAFACGVATVLEGIIGGWASKYIKGSSRMWSKALCVTAFSQTVQMITILIIAKPFDQVLELVRIIALPMITISSIGAALFILIIEEIFIEQQRIGGNYAQLALDIANKTLPIMRQGFNSNNLHKVANIILDRTEVAAVAFTDKTQILAHVGSGSDHHIPGNNILTGLTKKAIETRKIQIASSHEQIGCGDNKCPLNSAVIVPLSVRNEIIGTMKLYSEERNVIYKAVVRLAQGLASIFSSQIEISILDEQSRLLRKAEMKALQAQINPHFLFNSITTISSYCRTKPEQARNLLINLGEFFRKNLNAMNDYVCLKDEIEHIKSYVSIEKARFGDKLNVKYNIGNINCNIPPLTLQPLVENAIKHGLLQKNSGGVVKINVTKGKNHIKILVEDNGIGMDVSKCKDILNNDTSNNGIALINIDKRLRNAYGDDYGLEIKSKPGSGTKVFIKIPEKNSKKDDIYYD